MHSGVNTVRVAAETVCDALVYFGKGSRSLQSDCPTQNALGRPSGQTLRVLNTRCDQVRDFLFWAFFGDALAPRVARRIS